LARDCRGDLRGSEISSLDLREVERKGAIVTRKQTVVIAALLGLDAQPD
jgi:hypothetical protein